MISFFRRLFSSTLGVVIAIGFIVLIGFAFALADINAPAGMFSGSGTRLATIGDRDIDEEQINMLLTRALQQAREEAPGIDMAAFVDNGALDDAITDYGRRLALEQFAEDHDILVSKRLIDASIAEVPIFQGLTGEFDENTFRQVLAQQNLTEEQVRSDLLQETLRRVVFGPVAAAAVVPEAVARPYARLLLEERFGRIAAIPSAAMPQGNPPTSAEISAFYEENLDRYTLPERRAVRYAEFTVDQISVPTPTEEQVRTFYRQNSDRYGGSEQRLLNQIILPGEQAARAFYNEVRGGADFVEAAGERGFAEPATRVSGATEESFARTSSEEIAAAAFAAPEGRLLQPMRSDLGWHVIRVVEVRDEAATPLAQVRGEIVRELSEQLTNEALADFYLAIENAIDDGATFEEIVEDRGLTITATPLVAPSGRSFERPQFRGGADLPTVLQAAFTMDVDEDPVLIPLEEDRRYAMIDVTSIARSAPEELGAIRARVTRDFLRDRASRRARRIADEIVEKVSGDMDLAQALAEADVDLPPPQPAQATRAAISQAENVPEPLRLMFRMAADTAKLVRLPQNEGWLVVVLERIESNAEQVTNQIVAATQQQFQQVTAAEYAEQFFNALSADYPIERDEEAIEAFANRITGRSS